MGLHQIPDKSHLTDWFYYNIQRSHRSEYFVVAYMRLSRNFLTLVRGRIFGSYFKVLRTRRADLKIDYRKRKSIDAGTTPYSLHIYMCEMYRKN